MAHMEYQNLDDDGPDVNSGRRAGQDVKTVLVEIPPGVKPGQTLKAEHEGVSFTFVVPYQHGKKVKIEVPRHAQAQQIMQVRCPDDAAEGSQIMAQAPNGTYFKCTVPRGIRPGDIMHVNVPDAPQQPPPTAPPDPPAAATRLGVRIPEGAVPGQQMKATSPDGLEFNFTVPEGATAGSIVQLSIAPVGAEERSMPQAAASLRGAVRQGDVGRAPLIECESSTVSSTDVHGPTVNAVMARRSSFGGGRPPPPIDML